MPLFAEQRYKTRKLNKTLPKTFEGRRSITSRTYELGLKAVLVLPKKIAHKQGGIDLKAVLIPVTPD